MKPILVAPLIAVVLTGAGLGAYFAVAGAGSGEEAAPAQATATPTPAEHRSATPTPAPATKGQLWRWVNVTVVIAEDSDVYVVQTYYSGEVNPPDGGPVLTLVKDTNPSDEYSSSLLIDAEDGTILRDNVLDKDRPAIDQVLQTLTVAPLDRATAPWPYNGQAPPDLRRERIGNISYITPPPESGILIEGYIGDPGPSVALNITNGRSLLQVDALTGMRAPEEGRVDERDRPALERYLASIIVCGGEVSC